MRVVKKREGSAKYVVVWTLFALLITLGFLCFLWALFSLADGNSLMGYSLIVISIVLIVSSSSLFYRQTNLLSRFRNLQVSLNNARSGLRLAESMGVDTKRVEDLYHRVESGVGFSKLKDIENAAADLTLTLESLLTLHTDRLLDKALLRMKSRRESTGLQFEERSLVPVQKEFDAGNYFEVSRLLRAHNVASERIESALYAISRAEDLGLPTKGEKEELDRVLERLNTGDSSGARIDAVNLRDAVNDRIRDFVKEEYFLPVLQRIDDMGGRGIVSEEAMRALNEAGTNLLAANVNGTLKMVSESGMQMDEATREAIGRLLEKTVSLSDRAEKMGVDISAYPSRVEAAKDALYEGRLEESLEGMREIAKSLVVDMSDLVIREFEPLHSTIDRLFLVPESRLELTGILAQADDERKRGNYEDAIKIAERLRERLEEEGKESLRVLESSTEKLLEKVDNLEEKGMRVDNIRKAMEISQEKATDENYAKAMEIVLSATDLVNRNLSLHRDSVRTLDELSKLLTRTREKGVDVADLWDVMESLQEKEDLEKVIEEARRVEDDALQRMTDLTERTGLEIMRIKDKLNELVEDRVDVGSVPDLIEKAEEQLYGEDFTEAEKTLARASRHLDKILRLSEKFDEKLSEAKDLFARLETAGVPTSVFESDLQNIVSVKNKKSLKQVTDFLEEVCAERDRIKSQAKETIEESRTLMKEYPDIVFDEESRMVDRAHTAFEEGRFSRAFEIAVEGAGNARRKVELFQKSSEMLERASDDLDRLGKAGFDAHKLESDLQLCEMEKDPSIRIEKIKSLESEITKSERRLLQSMEWAIVEARHGIYVLDIFGVSASDLAEMLDSAEELASERIYREAEKKARNVRDLAEERANDFREAREKMTSLENIMEKAKEMGISFENLEEDLNWLKSSDDYQQIIERTGLMFDEINNLLEGKREDVRSFLNDLRYSVNEMKSSNILAPRVVELLDKAELELSQDSIIEAMDSCRLAEGKIEEVKDFHERWTQTRSSLEDTLNEAAESGIGVKDFFARLDDFASSGDYEAAIEKADGIIDDLDSRKTLMSTRILEDIRKTKEMIETSVQEGPDRDVLLDMLKAGEKGVQEEHYLSARQKVVEANRIAKESMMPIDVEISSQLDGQKLEIEKMRTQGIRIAGLNGLIQSVERNLREGRFEEGKTNLESLVEQMSRLRELHLEYLSAKETLEKRLERLDAPRSDLEAIEREKLNAETSEDYPESIRKLEELTSRAETLRTEMQERAERRLEEIRAFVGELENMGADVDDLLPVLAEAQQVLEEGGFVRALAKINRAAEMGEVAGKKRSFDNKFSETDTLLRTANEGGVDVSDLLERMEGLRDRNDYDEMTNELRAIEQEMNRRTNSS